MYNFSAKSGALIGLATVDDVAIAVPDTGCESAVYVAGTLQTACEDGVTTVCSYQR